MDSQTMRATARSSSSSIQIASDSSQQLAVPASPPSYDAIDNSDVFLCKPEPQRTVTLYVHGWHQVEPGILSWTFPSLRAALDAVQRMKNAIAWCVVSGTDWADLDTARARGAVLVEQVA